MARRAPSGVEREGKTFIVRVPGWSRADIPGPLAFGVNGIVGAVCLSGGER
jgi:hypothetical protein